MAKEGNSLLILQGFGHFGINSDPVDEQRFGFGEKLNQTGHLLEKESRVVLMQERRHWETSDVCPKRLANLVRIHVDKTEALGSRRLGFDQTDISFIQVGERVQGLEDGVH